LRVCSFLSSGDDFHPARMESLVGMEGMAEFDFEDDDWMDAVATSDFDSMLPWRGEGLTRDPIPTLVFAQPPPLGPPT
jgi:hypothetical protein